MTDATALPDRPEWQALRAHAAKTKDAAAREMFAADPRRFENFSLKTDGLFFDYSRHAVSGETMRLLFALARACGAEDWRDRMFAGEKINASENRAVLHTALRRPVSDQLVVESENVMPLVHSVLVRMEKFSEAVRSGAWKGLTGQRIETVVNIGIGGSDLGPRMVCAALETPEKQPVAVRFVSNVDGADLALALKNLNPETTLFLIASKTFTTQETMANAQAAKSWLLAALKDERAVARHFAALSTNEKAVAEFGIAPKNMFPFRDWVGGRYSLWSAIGLPVCMACGFETFRALLDGAHAMDRHFRETPLEKNLPALLALLGLWHRNFQGAQSHAVLPYSASLRLFPAWLQQTDMESNGKGVDRAGRRIAYDTGPVVFGAPGTDCQHSFFQLIHQGTTAIPCDFIGVIEPPPGSNPPAHELLLANLLAQAEALMAGRGHDDPQRAFAGNRPSSVLLLERLDAFHLGQLLALYEHKIFTQGVIWNINSFDQWGVELGKVVASGILTSGGSADPATSGLLRVIRNHMS